MSKFSLHSFLLPPLARFRSLTARQAMLYCILAWNIVQPASAQITITNSVFPAVGDTHHYLFGNQPGAINQIFTPPGGNQIWDLSGLQSTQTWNQNMQNPASGAAQALFPAASVLYKPANSSSEVYLQVTGTQVLDLGYFGQDELGLGLDLLFKKSPGLEAAWAPANFFDIHQSSSNVLTAFDAPMAPAVLLNLAPTADSFRIRVTYQRLGVIDAFGSLSIPGGTFDVLRKKQTEYKSTAVDVKVAPLGWIDISTIGGQQILPLGTDTITSFHFLNNVSKESIAICTLNTAQNAVTSVQYKNVNPSASTAVPTLEESLIAYPNPVHQTLYVHFINNTKASLQLKMINQYGSQALEQTVDSPSTENGIAVPVDNLPSGIYELIIKHGGAIIGQTRIVKI